MRMKRKKSILSITLAAALCASLLPAAALAATTVETDPGDSTLNVEYFSSTMYNWDENAANAATAVADASSYRSSSVRYSAVASSDNSSYTSTSYYYLVDSTYYPVYYTRTSSGSGWSQTTTYTLYYLNGSTYIQIGSTTNGNTSVTLYTASSYEGKGLYFTNGSNKQSVPTFSTWLDNAQNYMIYSGLAESNLAESENAPFDNDTVNAANLFATDGSNTSYTDVYTSVGVPFVYDESTGYYTLDSDQYAVYFDNGTSGAASNTNLTIADLPAAHSYTDISDYSYATGFLPFNDVSDSTATAVKSGGSSSGGTTAYTTSGSTVWGFGMALTVNFTMTEDGKITVTDENGDDVEEDIIFEFSGDDDVWVYVDNTLALDMGGTHDAITGTINFNSGDVILTAGSYNQIGDLSGKTSTSSVTTSSSLSQTNLYEALGTSLSDFASNGTHTLTVYYMERGRGRSNCKIKFNLPQTDTVSVTKQLNATDSEGEALSDTELDTNFTFTLYKNGSVVTNTDYIVQNANGVIADNGNTGSTGTFTLKGGQTAVFDLSLDGYRTYYVTETNPSTDETYYEDPNWTYSSNISNTIYVTTSSSAWTSDTAQLTGSKNTAESLTFVCTNTKSYAPSVKVNAVDDVVVIDYNLPVNVDVLDNDEVIGNDPTVSILSQGVDGTSVANSDNNSITYTLTKVLSEVDSVQYNLTATDTVDNKTTASDTATLSVVPASCVYYEDDFATTDDGSIVGITYSGSWTTDETNSDAIQSSDNVIYGTDAAYADVSDNNSLYSLGSVHAGEYGATATFTFEGTGVDIYSSTDNDACIVYAYLYEGENASGTMKQYAIANNYSDDGQYYVVPTVSFADLDYGTYTVKLTVLPNSANTSATTYYIDGIRVYNPLGTVTNDGSIAGNAYAAADELNAVYKEIRTMLLDKDADLTGGDGALFIDEITSSTTGETTTDLAIYKSDGPEHETYLKVGNGVAFTLSGFDADSDAVYVGIKLTGITTSTSTEEGALSGTVEVTDGSGKTTLNITSTADQYYKITPDDNGNIVIKNTSETGAVISLTKIRTTSADSENTTSVVSTEDTAVYALTTFNTLSLTTSESAVLTDDENSDESIDVVIETETSEEKGSDSQSSFSSIFNKVVSWIIGRR